jgi:Anti-sigma-28 factor, FlgM
VTSGEGPIDRCPCDVDTTHMTVQESRYVTRERMTGPSRDGGRRFGRRPPPAPPTDGGLTKVEQLRERIVRGTYEVDSTAVAAAIIARLLERAETSEGKSDERLA